MRVEHSLGLLDSFRVVLRDRRLQGDDFIIAKRRAEETRRVDEPLRCRQKRLRVDVSTLNKRNAGEEA